MNRFAGVFATLLIALAAIGSMLPLSRADFTNWDDPHTVTENPEMLPPTLRSLGHLWEGPRADLYVPVTYTFWWTIAHVAEDRADHGEPSLSPLPFHLANLALHAAASVLVVLILHRLHRNWFIAAAGALFFAVHPVQVEAVGWISGGKDLLCGALSLASILAYLNYADRSATATTARQKQAAAICWIAAATLLTLAMLSKPAAMVVPWICVIVQSLLPSSSARRIVRGAVPLVLLSIPFAILAAIVQPAAWNTTLVSPLLRPLVALDALSFYFRQICWPATLTVDYGRYPRFIFESGAVRWSWIPAGAVLAAAIVFSARGKKLSPAAAGLAIFVVALLPVLGFVPFDYQEYSTVADHYLYLPMLGVAMIAAALVRRLDRRTISIAIVTIIAALLAVRSWKQTKVWEDSESLFTHQIQAQPNSFLGYNNLVPLLIDRGHLDEASVMAKHSIELRTDNPVAWINLGNIALERRDPPTAIEAFRRSIQLEQRRKGRAIEAHVNLANALGQAGDLDGAIEAYEYVLKVDPSNKIARRMLPRTLAYRASRGKKS